MSESPSSQWSGVSGFIPVQSQEFQPPITSTQEDQSFGPNPEEEDPISSQIPDQSLSQIPNSQPSQSLSQSLKKRKKKKVKGGGF